MSGKQIDRLAKSNAYALHRDAAERFDQLEHEQASQAKLENLEKQIVRAREEREGGKVSAPPQHSKITEFKEKLKVLEKISRQAKIKRETGEIETKHEEQLKEWLEILDTDYRDLLKKILPYEDYRARLQQFGLDPEQAFHKHLELFHIAQLRELRSIQSRVEKLLNDWGVQFQAYPSIVIPSEIPIDPRISAVDATAKHYVENQRQQEAHRQAMAQAAESSSHYPGGHTQEEISPLLEHEPADLAPSSPSHSKKPSEDDLIDLEAEEPEQSWEYLLDNYKTGSHPAIQITGTSNPGWPQAHTEGAFNSRTHTSAHKAIQITGTSNPGWPQAHSEGAFNSRTHTSAHKAIQIKCTSNPGWPQAHTEGAFNSQTHTSAHKAIQITGTSNPGWTQAHTEGAFNSQTHTSAHKAIQIKCTSNPGWPQAHTEGAFNSQTHTSAHKAIQIKCTSNPGWPQAHTEGAFNSRTHTSAHKAIQIKCTSNPGWPQAHTEGAFNSQTYTSAHKAIQITGTSNPGWTQAHTEGAFNSQTYTSAHKAIQITGTSNPGWTQAHTEGAFNSQTHTSAHKAIQITGTSNPGWTQAHTESGTTSHTRTQSKKAKAQAQAHMERAFYSCTRPLAIEAHTLSLFNRQPHTPSTQAKPNGLCIVHPKVLGG
ncbi:hypothetical protein ACQY0O_008149 [Thecaphora frezii]